MHFQRDRNLGTRASYSQSVADTSSASSIFNDLGMEDAFSVRWLQQYIINTSALLLSAERVGRPWLSSEAVKGKRKG